MEIRQIQTFRMVAKELSFTRAAEILNYAQSSVTAQIQALEEEFDIPLFERLGKRIILTGAGQRLLDYSEKLLQMIDEAKIVVPGKKEPGGTLHIGASESLLTYRLPSILREFRNRYPDVQLNLTPGKCTDLRMALAYGKLDVALLLETPVHIATLNIESLIQEKILLLAEPNHPLTEKHKIIPADLKNEILIVTEAGSSYRELFEKELENAGIYPASKFEFASVEVIKQSVMVGIGIAVLPEITVKTEITQGRLSVLPWEWEDSPIVTQLAWHKDKWLSPALNAFIQHVIHAIKP